MKFIQIIKNSNWNNIIQNLFRNGMAFFQMPLHICIVSIIWLERLPIIASVIKLEFTNKFEMKQRITFNYMEKSPMRILWGHICAKSQFYWFFNCALVFLSDMKIVWFCFVFPMSLIARSYSDSKRLQILISNTSKMPTLPKVSKMGELGAFGFLNIAVESAVER